MKHFFQGRHRLLLFVICCIYTMVVQNTPVAGQPYPGGVGTNITLWLKANTATNLTYNGGGSVSAWNSEVGTYGVTQATVSRQPVLISAPDPNVDFNFNPSLQFLVSGQRALSNVNATPDLLGTNGTVFLVVNTYLPSGSSSSSCFAYMSASNYRYQVKADFRLQTGNNGLGYTADISPTTEYPAIAGRTLVSSGTGAGFSARRNAAGIPINHSADATYNPAIGTGLCVGSNSNGGGSEYSNSAIAEVITYNTTLSAPEANRIESYLAVKYGLTLAQTTPTSYTSASGTTVWDAVSQTGYAQNITGIGRDDASGLLQKQSKSVNNKGIIYYYNDNTGGVFPTTNATNTTSFNANNTYYIAGDNGGDTALTACTEGGYVRRMARVWKGQQTGMIDLVTIAVDADRIPAAVTTLLVSEQPGFPDGLVRHYPLRTSGSKKYVTLSLSSRDYFTFGADSIAFSAGSNSPLCVGETLLLTATAAAGSIFQWSGPLGFGSTDQHPVIPDMTVSRGGSYNLVIRHGSCATAPFTVPVSVYDRPVAAFTPVVRGGCAADTVVFMNTSTASTAYRWDFGDGSGSSAVSPEHIYGTQGRYQVTLYASGPYCADTLVREIDLVHPVMAGFTTDDDTVCQGSTILFTNTSVATGPVYSWEMGDGSTDNTRDVSYTFHHPGRYRVLLTITDINGCTDTASRYITVDSVYMPDLLVQDTILCTGGVVNGLVTGADSGVRLSWDMGDGSQYPGSRVHHAYDQAGSFLITLTAHADRCPDVKKEQTIQVNAYPVADLGPDTTLCPNSPPMEITDRINKDDADASWLWNTGAVTASITVQQPGNYSVTVTVLGCSTTDSITVRPDCYLGIPNIFTPNNDGINDYFFPRQQLSDGISLFRMTVFNRWGQRIFETARADGRGWDGRLNGADQPGGVYIYQIEVTFRNGVREQYTGNVTLVR